MKTKGSITHIGVSLKELNRIYKEDAVIPVSKKALKAYMMAAGIEEDIKPISLKVTDNTVKTEKIVEIKPEPEVEATQPVPESNPPIELNVSNGDW